MDGQIAVADFGVRRLYELLTPGSQSGFFYGSLEALAPEQLTGGQIGSYTDVYALGAVTYRLLTGHTVFSGDNFRAVAEQHLHAPPPSLAQARRRIAGRAGSCAGGRACQGPGAAHPASGRVRRRLPPIIAPANTRRVPFDSPGGPLGASSSSQSGPSGPTGQSGQLAITMALPQPRSNLGQLPASHSLPPRSTTPSARGMRQFICP